MKQLYLDIEAKIKAEVPEVKHVDIWNNQLDSQEEQDIYSFEMPAVFIEFADLNDIQQLGGGMQIYNDMLVIAHVCHQELDAGDGTIDRDVNVFTLKQKVFMALNKFQPTGCASFDRKGETQDINHTNIYHYIQSYKTNYVDAQRVEPVGSITKTPPTQLEVTATKVNAIT